jgi:hypothetical protein
MLSKRTFFTALSAFICRTIVIDKPNGDLSFPGPLLDYYIHGRHLSKVERARQKKAIAEVVEFNRMKLLEDRAHFYKRILPPIPITIDELDRLTPPVPITEDKEEKDHVE